MKKYNKYKDSGIEWIGKIPEHWEIKKLKKSANFINGFAFNSDEYVDEGIKIVRIGDIKPPYVDLNDCKKVPSNLIKELKEFKLKKGDILLALTGATIGKSAIYNLDEEALLNQRVAILRGNGILVQNFLKYVIQSSLFTEYIDIKCFGGAQENIGKKEISFFPAIVPIEKEQITISDYLDEATKKLNKVIENKKRQIELIAEKEKININYITTDGLSIKTNNLVVESVGQLSKKWKSYKLKSVLDSKEGMRIGPFGSTLKLEIMKDKGFKVYSQENVIYRDFSLGNKFIDEDKFESMKNYELYPDDIVIAMMGTIGNSIIVPSNIVKGIMDSHLLRMRVNNNVILSKYLALILNKSYYLYNDINKNSKGAIMDGLNSKIIKNLYLLVPTINEQKQIIYFIENLENNITKLINKTENEISLLDEYKKILINDVVTGKMKVTA